MLTILTIVLCSLRLTKASLGCGDVKLSEVTQYKCNEPGVFTQSDLPQMPVGGKDIFVQAEIKIDDFCGRSPPYHFLTLSIEPTIGSQVKLMDIQWNGAKRLKLSTEDISSIQDAYEVVLSQNQPSGQWFSFTAWVQLGSNQASGFFTYYGPEAVATTGALLSYLSTWTIDMNPNIFVCSNFNGADSIACEVTNFKVWYQAASNLDHMRDGTTPKLIAQYKLNQYSGYKVNDTAPNSLGTAYFGASTASAEDSISTNMPRWISEEDPSTNKLMEYTGISFQAMQYLTLPTFPIAQSLNSPAYSLTLKLWLRLAGTSGGVRYVFRYSNPDLTIDIFALQIISSRLRIGVYNTVTLSNTLLSTTVWNSVAITVTSLDYANTASSTGPFPYYYSWLINNVPESQTPTPLSADTRYVYDVSNVVRLGGPPSVIGIIAGVEIYNPGSDLMTAPTSCQPSTCLRDLGVTSPSTCLLPICAANCAACFNSQENGCLACNTGYRLYQSKCVTLMCKPGKYLDSSNTCQNCISNCESCSDSTSCNTCFSGFINQGSTCVCPSGSTLNTITSTCQYNCIANCASCSDGTSCDVCNTGFILQGSVCTCPTGSVLDTTTNTCVAQNNGNPCNNPLYFYYPNENICKATCKYPFKIINGSPLQSCVLDIDETDSAQAETAAQISMATSYATNIGGALIALLSSSNIGLLLIGSLTEMLSYIQYLKIDYPPKVYLMLYEQNINSGGINIITEIPEEVADAIPNHPLPEEFAKNDTYSSFVANSWEFLISLCSLLLIIGFISLFISCFTKSRGKLHSFLSKLLSSLRWNLFFGIFCSGYGFTGIFTALEFRTVNMDSALSIFSFVVSLVINTLGFWVLYYIVHLSMIFRSIQKTVRNPEERAKQLEEAEETWKSYQVLFEEYKDDHLSQKMFLFIFMFRTYIHYSILGYLNEYPFLQTCSFTVISISILLYLIIRRPMKGRMSYIQQMVCEVAILIVNISVLILSVMDKWIIGDHDSRVRVGDVIIATNFGLSIAGSVFLIIETLSQLNDAYLFIRSWLNSQKNTKKLFKIQKRDLKKSLDTLKSQPVFDTESQIKELDISDLEKSNDLSSCQLKPV